jgi:uncharacterized protein YcbK (DUF882 family)
MRVTGTPALNRHHIVRLLIAALMSMTVLLPSLTVTAHAANERSLYLYYTHTKETARIVFKRNGQYVQSGLRELNHFLRDWRRNEPAKMDPRLFDLIWEVYEEVGASQPINIVSAYRSPATNAMLRASSSGVAENSQHMRGNAMDFFIPGVSLSKLRAVAMSKQVGGVGFYPTSGSPFVHLDTGNVRAWPRMTRAQLKQVFPDGKTLHVPTDGKPLSQEGYRIAQAEWQRCHAVPCGSTTTRLASNNGGSSGRTLVDLFSGGGQQQPAPAPAQVQLASVSASRGEPTPPPVPMMRPQALGAPVQTASVDQPPVLPFSTEGSAPLDEAELMTAAAAPVPATKSQAMLVATAAALPADNSETAVTALAALGQPFPQPRLHMSDPPAEPAMVTAYVQEPGTQKTLEMIIDRNTTAAIAPKPLPPLTAATGIHTASLGGEPEVGALLGLFDRTFGAVEQQDAGAPMAKALADFAATRAAPANGMRDVDLIAPDLEHVAETLTAPVVMTAGHFAVITEHDEADFDPATELGRYVTVMGVGDEPQALSHERFVTAQPLAVATN